MRRRKFTKIYIILALFISIGFAYLSTNLNINGTSMFKSSSWNVYFDNIEVDSGSVELQSGDSSPTISSDKLTVSYQVTCNNPGDYYKFNIDVVNDGSLNAKIDSITIPEIPEGYEDNIEFSLKYLDGTNVEEDNVLLAGEKTTFVITTKNRDDISADQLISEAITLPMEVSISYTQIKSSDITTATFKTGWEVSTLMNDLAEKINGVDSNNIKYFLHSETLDDNSNIISTEDSDVPIYMWYEETNEDYQNTEQYYGIIYWYSEAQVVYLNEDSSFFFNHNLYSHDIYLNEYNEYSEEEELESLEFKNLADISGISQINASSAKNLTSMFDNCSSLTSLSGLEKWNISNVTTLNFIFNECINLKSITSIENWDVSSVIYMNDMFLDCKCISSLTSLSNWDVSSVEYMSGTFWGCSSLTSLTGIESWDVSNVIYLEYLFNYCSNLTSLSSISNWDVSSANTTEHMFGYCTSLTSLTGLENWDVSSVTTMVNMFFYCTNLSSLSSISNWDVSNVTNMNYMFSFCRSLLDATEIEDWGTRLNPNLTYASMFSSYTPTRPSWYV